MFRGLYRLLVAAGDWRPRDFLLGVVAAELVALMAVVSLGFATFAAYTHFAASEGPVFAALVISVSYGMVAIIAGIVLARWHARTSHHEARAPAAPEDLELLLRSLGEAGNAQDQAALIAALRLGRDLTPMELLAVSLIGGFFAGRRAGK
ncbi:hypothetical protein [Neoroseomonas lacus]|uniref:Uncharacterized protein n=1 Tax=Neoroseomonas lacus TaxID=287609 RepID=A0A917L898_9PROT|nr:hypothetical protein [Neoroseomonas lacus]GGJ45378.1 hypothetical protein GCM10011320_61000 [Neoroseomonas lacus]